MPRKLRIEYADVLYHVMSRANGKGDVYLSDVDRQDLSKTLAEACPKTVRWTEHDLQQRAKGDPAKLALAARVRRETTPTIRWLAGRLHLGSWKSFAAKLHRWRQTDEKGQP